MRNDHLAQFLTQTRERLKGSQDPLTVHRRERFIEKKELWRTSDRPHKSLGKGETKAEGKPLQGASREFMSLKKIALFSSEETDLELWSHLSITVASAGQMRQQSAQSLAKTWTGTHPHRLDGFIEQLDQQSMNVHLVTNRQ